MQQRKRLTRLNRKPLDSFDQFDQDEYLPFNLLNQIQNQNLYSKLVTLTLQISHDAGVSQASLHEMQSKLLAAKGLNQDMMLNAGSQYQPKKNNKQQELFPYNPYSKWINSTEQVAFLSKMEKEVEEVQVKESLVCALKKYISQKKKAIEEAFPKPISLTWKNKFQNKIQQQKQTKHISRSQFYFQTLRDILNRIHAASDQSHTFVENYRNLKSLWGHTFHAQMDEEYCPVYNAIFDNSGQLIITGGEDGLIKIWSRDTGLLLSNLKGHKDFINKITVTRCNKYLLSAGNDCIRFFDLRTMNSIGGFKIQSVMDITTINQDDSFTIIFADNRRIFLLDEKTMLSHRNVKLQPHDFQIFYFGDRIKEDTLNTILFTVNENRQVLLGNTAGQILLFNFDDLPFNKGEIQQMYKGAPQFSLPVISVINAHEGDILQIKWHSDMLRFASGGKKDGCCRIWDLQNFQEHRKPLLIKELKIPKYKIKRKRKIYHCNFITFNSQNTYLACSFQEQEQEEETDLRGDGQIIVYNLYKNEVTWQVSRDIELSSVRGLQFHPIYENILLIGDAFGKIILTDIYMNSVTNIFEERGFHLNHPSFPVVPTECKFSSDGNYFLVSTEYGNVSLYGYDIQSFYYRVPSEQFFQNDYDQIQIENNSFKPISNSSLTLDVNQLERGPIKNSRMITHQNLTTVDMKQFKKKLDENLSLKINNMAKINHKNCSRMKNEKIIEIKESMMDNERIMEVFKNNLEEVENKRLTVLFQERQSKNEKLRELIQEKLNSLRDIEQGNTVILQSFEKQLQTSNKNPAKRGRGRPSQQNNSNRRSPPVYDIQDDEEQRPNQIMEESFEIEEQQEEDYEENMSQSILDDEIDDQQFDSQSSEPQLYNRRKNKARKQLRNRPNPKRRYLRQRRPPAEEVMQLELQYDQYNRSRKRVHKEEDDVEENITPIRNYTFSRRNHSHMVVSDNCDDCGNRQSTVVCSTCKIKKYCDNCKHFNGKKMIKVPEYNCFECIYENNPGAERKKSKTDEKYRMINRKEAFMPQIDDQVVYFFQGYQQFLNEKIEFINNHFLYEEDGNNFPLRPHEGKPDLKIPCKCVVKDVIYINPVQTDLEAFNVHKRGARGRFTRPVEDVFSLIRLSTQENGQFTVFFIPGHEFLLKWQIFDDINNNNRFDQIALYELYFMKDEEVQVMQIQPINEKYSYSIWKNIIVHKTQNKNLRRQKQSQSFRINIWNLSGILDEKAFEFQTLIQEEKKIQFLKRIQKVSEFDPNTWEIFKNFVDSDKYPEYHEFVEVGVCLNQITQRLINDYYRSQDSFIKDVHLLYENSVKFNGQNTYVTDKAGKLVSMILFGEVLKEPQPLDEEPQISQNNNSTEKKTTKRKKNSSQKKSKEEELENPQVSSFQSPQQVSNKRITRNKRKRYNESDESEELKEEEDEDDYGLQRRKTRNMGKPKQTVLSQVNNSGRLTRSRHRK